MPSQQLFKNSEKFIKRSTKIRIEDTTTTLTGNLMKIDKIKTIITTDTRITTESHLMSSKEETKDKKDKDNRNNNNMLRQTTNQEETEVDNRRIIKMEELSKTEIADTTMEIPAIIHNNSERDKDEQTKRT